MHRAWLSTLLVCTAVAASCAKTTRPAGGVMVAFSTDVAIPTDVDTLYVQITQTGVTLYDASYPIGPSPSQTMPASLMILPPSGNPTAPVQIRVVATHAGTARVLRDTVLIVPSDRVTELRMPINWLCDGSGANDGTDSNGNPQFKAVTCPTQGQTCSQGICVAAQVDTDTLPPYNPADIFGGGTGDGDGQCFDTLGCFATSTPADVDLASCTAALPADASDANFGIRTPSGGSGICSSDGTLCVVPLDAQDPGGWYTVSTSAGPRALLPSLACTLVESKAAIDIVTSTKCPAKPPSLPPCGPWSSAGNGDLGTTDASAPVEDGSVASPNDAAPNDASPGAEDSGTDANTCSDGIKDGNETGVDCGSGTCPPCGPGQGCNVAGDCASNRCGAAKTCACADPTMMVAMGPSTAYCIDSTEVTNASYATFLSQTPAAAPAACAFKAGSYTPSSPIPSGEPNLPVANVDWCDAYAYCATASKRLCQNSAGFASPASTQDEWYAACSNGGAQTYPYGNTFQVSVCNGAGYPGGGAAIATGQDTGCLAADGALDLSGNLAEWEDSCNASTGSGDSCLVRGGSFASQQSSLTCATSVAYARSSTDETIGFRCCASD